MDRETGVGIKKESSMSMLRTTKQACTLLKYTHVSLKM